MLEYAPAIILAAVVAAVGVVIVELASSAVVGLASHTPYIAWSQPIKYGGYWLTVVSVIGGRPGPVMLFKAVKGVAVGVAVSCGSYTLGGFTVGYCLYEASSYPVMPLGG